MQHTTRIWEQDQVQQMDDGGADDSSDSSILGGLGEIAHGIGDAASSAAHAVGHAAEGVGDLAEGMWHSTEAAADAWMGDMPSAEQRNAESFDDADHMRARFHQAGQDIWGGDAGAGDGSDGGDGSYDAGGDGGDGSYDGSYGDGSSDGGDAGSDGE